MKTRNSGITWLLDQLSGTYPNDERTSRINEKGFALCGLFYFFAVAFRTVQILVSGVTKVNGFQDPSVFAPAVLLVMLLIMLAITIKQRRTEAQVQKKPHVKLRLTELPRAAAALLSGKSTEDERSVQMFERGFAVCALIGITFFAVCWLQCICCWYFLSTFVFLCAAPVLLGYVKLRENILTPPRFGHIPLSTKHLLLRLPVYLLAVLPFLLAASYVYAAGDGIYEQVWRSSYSDNLFVMFWQASADAFPFWLRNPWHIPVESLYYCGLFYIAVVIVNEFIVFLYRRQMRRMDAEENDLS